MEQEKLFSVDDVKHCFEMLDALKKRAYKIAPLCTNINSQEEITGMWKDGEDISIGVWSHNCGNDRYDFPMEYFSMTIDEIKRAEQEKAEKARKRAEREARMEKKRRERQERREYERLKKKFG